MKLHRWIALLPLLTACEADPRRYVQEAQSVRGDCSEEGLKRAEEECVQAMERGILKVQEMMESYTGALHSLDRALDRNPPVAFDTTLAGAVRVDPARPNGEGWADTRWGRSAPRAATRAYPAAPDPYEAARYPDPTVPPPARAYDGPSGPLPRRPAAYPDLVEERNARYEELRRWRYGEPETEPETVVEGREEYRPAAGERRESAYRPGWEGGAELTCEGALYELDLLEQEADRLGPEERREVARLRSDVATRCAPRQPVGGAYPERGGRGRPRPR